MVRWFWDPCKIQNIMVWRINQFHFGNECIFAGCTFSHAGCCLYLYVTKCPRLCEPVIEWELSSFLELGVATWGERRMRVDLAKSQTWETEKAFKSANYVGSMSRDRLQTQDVLLRGKKSKSMYVVESTRHVSTLSKQVPETKVSGTSESWI